MSDPVDKALEQVAGELYGDLAKPSTKVIGITLGRTVKLALAPLRAALWVGEEGEQVITEAVTARLKQKKVNISNIIYPDPLVAGQILDAFRFAQHTDLKRLFVELLTTSLIEEEAPNAHPSFVQILRSITPDEAKLLKYIESDGAQPFLEIRINNHDGSYHVQDRFYSGIAETANCQFPHFLPSYVDNFERLGILEYTPDPLAVNELYIELEKSDKLNEIKDEIESSSDSHCQLIRKSIRITDFGKQFCSASGIETPKLVFVEEKRSNG